MNKTKIVYKCVHEKDSKLLSAFIGTITDADKRMFKGHDLALEYQLNKETKPYIGRCFAFDTLKHAKHWIEHEYGKDCQIWRASATGVIHCRRSIYNNYQDIFWYLSEFWFNKIKAWSTPPKGTMLCSSIKLIKRVK